MLELSQIAALVIFIGGMMIMVEGLGAVGFFRNKDKSIVIS